MAPEIIAQSAASHSNHFNQVEFLHSTTVKRRDCSIWTLRRSNPCAALRLPDLAHSRIGKTAFDSPTLFLSFTGHSLRSRRARSDVTHFCVAPPPGRPVTTSYTKREENKDLAAAAEHLDK